MVRGAERHPFLIMIRDLMDRFEWLQDRIGETPVLVGGIVEEYDDVILSLNRDQLLSGRNTEGMPLTPGYLDDPYFNSRDAAERYARMKYALESQHRARMWNPQLFPDKDSNTPNLIVRGDFQDGMYINTTKDSYGIGSTYHSSNDIETKYHHRVFGLAEVSKSYFWNNFLGPSLKKAYGL